MLERGMNGIFDADWLDDESKTLIRYPRKLRHRSKLRTIITRFDGGPNNENRSVNRRRGAPCCTDSLLNTKVDDVKLTCLISKMVVLEIASVDNRCSERQRSRDAAFDRKCSQGDKGRNQKDFHCSFSVVEKMRVSRHCQRKEGTETRRIVPGNKVAFREAKQSLWFLWFMLWRQLFLCSCRFLKNPQSACQILLWILHQYRMLNVVKEVANRDIGKEYVHFHFSGRNVSELPETMTYCT